jgi:glycine/D-amino acid oxidase-like deaminating enzyme
MQLPTRASYVVIGAGVHGLSTAWHLAKELKARGRSSGEDVIVLDKTGVAAGASGIACGVIRNNYFQPAMRKLMAHSVSVWESDPEAFAYHPVGYMQISPEVMHDDVVQIYKEQQAIGYPSTLVEGEEECLEYMRNIFHDWQAENITSILHECRGGYANNKASIRALAAKAQAEGVRIHTGVRVTGFRMEDGRVSAVKTDGPAVGCEHLVVAVGPWVRDIWAMLDLPEKITVKGPDGELYRNREMWTYWSLQEGVLGVEPSFLTDNEGGMPPVIHVDTDAPLYDEEGELVTDELWGIYYKPDFYFNGVQGGATPYGRFEGKSSLFSREPSGGIGCFTPDSFPVFDTFKNNAYFIADSNHGYKMIGVGALVAKELMDEPQELLEPFRFSRYETGELHPTSHSPFPWS